MLGEGVWSAHGPFQGICLERRSKNHKNLRTVDIAPETRIEHLPNKVLIVDRVLGYMRSELKVWTVDVRAVAP
jgi:hypothetical protein